MKALILLLLAAAPAFAQVTYTAYQLVGAPPPFTSAPFTSQPGVPPSPGTASSGPTEATALATNGTDYVGLWSYSELNNPPVSATIWLNGLTQPGTDLNSLVLNDATIIQQESGTLTQAVSIDANGNIIADYVPSTMINPPPWTPVYYLLLPTVSQAQAQLTSATAQLAALQAQVAKLQAQVTSLQGQVATLQTQNATLKEDFAQIAAEIGSYYAPSVDKYYSMYAACEKKL